MYASRDTQYKIEKKNLDFRNDFFPTYLQLWIPAHHAVMPITIQNFTIEFSLSVLQKSLL